MLTVLHFSHNEAINAINNTQKHHKTNVKHIFHSKVLICLMINLILMFIICVICVIFIYLIKNVPALWQSKHSLLTGRNLRQDQAVTSDRVFILVICVMSHLSPETETKCLCCGTVVCGRTVAPADFLI